LVLLSLSVAALSTAQAVAGQTPTVRLSMAEAVRLALEHNHQLLAQRLNVDIARADEITAALKPNPIATTLNQAFPVFSPSQLTPDNLANIPSYTESLSYLFERGRKRENRTVVAQDSTVVASQTSADAERQLIFQTRQTFINVLLAKSTLDLAREDLQNFSEVVEVNRQRMNLGDLAEGDFYKISVQQLQFEQDVSAAEVAVVQAKAALRQDVGIDLAYTKYAVTLDDLKRQAEASRPDLQAAQSGTKLARDTQALAFSNRVIDVTGEIEYERFGPVNGMGFFVSVPLPIHDRNQGNIAHSQVAIRQASETELQARTTVVTDVVTAYAAFQANEKILSIFQSGYLDQATQSLEISRYVYQQGSGNLLDLLDAERTNRATQLAFRQALAAYMTSVQQINFAVGMQVMP
jgi:cobalt-zinc-cadmium efflux system outer membrane protein